MLETQSQDTINHRFEQAFSYLEKQRWNIIPIGVNKKPLIEWKTYQTQRATKEQIIEWFKKYPNANIGVVTGKISNLAVIDIDPRHGGKDKEFVRLVTVKTKTGGGGWHYYFQYEEGLQNQVGIKPGIDIRAEGGYVIAPPSKTESGEYQWVMSPQGGTEILALPDFVKEWIQNTRQGETSKSNWNKDVLNGVADGSRNESAASVAGKLLKRFPKEEWESEAWPLFQGWNGKNQPPLSEDELRTVFDSIKKKELGNSESQKKDIPTFLQLVKEVEKENIIFFHDQYKDGYAAIKGDGREILKLRSKLFKQYLAKFIYEKSGKIISSNTLLNIIQVLEGKALYDGPKHDLSVRITKQGESIWYDLGNGSVVHIDKDGWRISDTPPILFRRFHHQLAQVNPRQRGHLHELCKFVNLQNDEEKLLFIVYTVAAFIPDFSHPVLVFYGPQGAGKTTPHRILKSLIDPSILSELSAPDNEREFVQQASHHWFFYLDNLSSLPKWLSDALAKACTGSGFSKRELFSDDDDIIYSFKRIVGLNGINLVVESADLLDRSILIGLERIPKDKRLREQEFWKEFESVKPLLLGAIFNAISGALKTFDTISLPSYPRMADFAHWGTAIAKALGYPEIEFLRAYTKNISQQNEAAIDASPVGTTITAYMNNREGWEGTATDLLTVLEEQAKELKINVIARNWPKDPSSLGRKIQLIQSNLAEKGIKVTKDEKARPRRISILKVAENADAPVGSDGRDNKGLNQPTAIENIPADAVGEYRLSQSLPSGATPPTPLSSNQEEYKDEELEDVSQLELVKEE